MKIVGVALSWILGVCLIFFAVVAGLLAFSSGIIFFSAYLFLLGGVLMLPPIQNKTGLEPHRGKVAIFSVSLFFLGVLVMSQAVDSELAKEAAEEKGYKSASDYKEAQRLGVQDPKRLQEALEKEAKEKAAKEVERKKVAAKAAKEAERRKAEEAAKEAIQKKVANEKAANLSSRQSKKIYTGKDIAALAISKKLSEVCNGVEPTELLPIEIRRVLKQDKKNQLILDNSRQIFVMVLEQMSALEKLQHCFDALRQFGPNGTTWKGLVTPSKKMLETMPDVLKKEIGL